MAGNFQNEYNLSVAGQLGALNSLYGAGDTTAGLLSTLDQARLGNMKAGIGAADAAITAQIWGPTQMLAVEAQRRGIPLQTLAAQYGMVLPAAQAFATKPVPPPARNPVQLGLRLIVRHHGRTSSGQGTQNTTRARPSIRCRSCRWLRAVHGRHEPGGLVRARSAAGCSARSATALWGPERSGRRED